MIVSWACSLGHKEKPMCYSAQIWANYRKYERAFNTKVSIEDFVKTYWVRSKDPKVKIPKAMDAAFAAPISADEQRIHALIEEFDQQQTSKREQELFQQKKRLADAERILQTRTTKAATENKRIASDKIKWILGALSDLRRSETTERDSRIFPGWYAPVMVMERGERLLKPMRYQCRPAGKPAFYDSKYPGTYNARRDNLEGFWKGQFGRSHGVMVASAFFEHVSRHAMQGRELAAGEKEESVILEFRPNTSEPMLVACLWSHWQGEGEAELDSFAAITDDPPAEVAAAGHDRCIIPIKPEHIDAWLTPDPANLAASYRILDDRQRPYYEHRLAA